MDRMEEYKNLMAELEREPDSLRGAVSRAAKRARRQRLRTRLTQSAVGFASLAACFVLTVNFCVPVALACGRVPVLRELTQAVIWSPSLSAAVVNEHVQRIDQEQTVNGYTVRLEYVIADQKQVNVFLTVESDSADADTVSAHVDVADPNAPPHTIVGSLTKLGEMDYICINFVDGNTPEHLDLTVTVEDAVGEPDELVSCEFSVDLDPYLLRQGRVVEVDQDFVLDGNTLTLSTVELYPTHMRLNVEQEEDNPDYLKALTVIIDGDGRSVDREDNKGLSSMGGGKYGTYSIYTASSWYYDCDELTVSISGAVWVDKDRQETIIDLTTGEAEGLPDGVKFVGVLNAENSRYHDANDGNILEFLAPDSPYISPFGWDFWDEAGNSYRCQGTSFGFMTEGEHSGVHYHLGDFSGDRVVLENTYSHITELAQPLVLTVEVSQ